MLVNVPHVPETVNKTLVSSIKLEESKKPYVLPMVVPMVTYTPQQKWTVPLFVLIDKLDVIYLEMMKKTLLLQSSPNVNKMSLHLMSYQDKNWRDIRF